MQARDIIAKAIGVVTFLFAAFSGFLRHIAPPEEAGPHFAVGFSSVMTLCVLLLISALPRKKQTKASFWNIFLIVAGVLFMAAVVSGLVYKSNLERLTFPYPADSPAARHVRGTVYTPAAQAELDQHSLKTIPALVADFGGISALELVWTRDSINEAKMVLTINYVIVVLTIASGIFCLTEGLLVKQTRNRNAR